jgi:hypothetical protein
MSSIKDIRLPRPHHTWINDYTIKLTAPFIWGTEQVPAGFSCDGASIPRFAYAWATPIGTGGMLSASIFHDYHYQVKEDKTGAPMGHFQMLRDGTLEPITRSEADKRFYHRLRLSGIRSSKAWVAYWALRIVGGIAWRSYTPQK